MATTTSQMEFPTQVAPLASEFYGAAVPQFKQALETGYQRPTTPLVTPFSAQELEAMTGLESLARGPGAAPGYQTGQQMTMMGAAPIGQTDLGRLMSPYMSGVTEAAKRQAVQDYQRTVRQPMMTQATASGGLRGARAGIERGLGQEALARTLSDIESTGLQKAYDQAMAAASAEKQRLLAAAPQYANLGTGEYQADLSNLQLLSGVGETQRGLADVARQAELQQELAAQNYPIAALDQYFQYLGSPSNRTITEPDPVLNKPSGIGQAIGTGLGLLSAAPQVVSGLGSLFGKTGLFGSQGLLGGNTGGRVGGLSTLIRMASGGPVGQAQQVADERRQAYLDLLNKEEPVSQWVTDVFGGYSPGDMTPTQQMALAPQYLEQVANAPTQRTTKLGQLAEALIRAGGVYSGGAQAATDQQKKQTVARAAAASEAADKRLKQLLDVSEQGRKERESQIKPLVDFYTGLQNQRAVAESAGNRAAVEAIDSQLSQLSVILPKVMGLPMIPPTPTDSGAPAGSGNSRDQSSAAVRNAEEVAAAIARSGGGS